MLARVRWQNGCVAKKPTFRELAPTLHDHMKKVQEAVKNSGLIFSDDDEEVMREIEAEDQAATLEIDDDVERL